MLQSYMRAIRNGGVARMVCVFIVMAVALPGCASMHRVTLPAGGAPQVSRPISPGDKVKVTLRDGRLVSFTVHSVEAAALVARDDAKTRYEFTDILIVERRQVSGIKTGILVAGVVAGALLVLIAAAAAAVYGGG